MTAVSILREPIVPDSARGPAIQGLLVALLFFGVFGGWLALAPLTGAVIGSATIRVEAHRQAVQHVDGGTVRQILVREGEPVLGNQILVRLDDLALKANADVLLGQRDALLAQSARLIAERDGAETVAFQPEISGRSGNREVEALMAAQRALFASRQNALAGQINVHRKRIEQQREQIRGNTSQLESSRRQLGIAADERSGLTQLLEKGFVARTRVLALDREIAALEGRVGDLDASNSRALQVIAEAMAEIERINRDRAAQIMQDLTDAQRVLREVEPKLVATLEALNRVDLRAPRTGRVVGLSVFNAGAVIRPGDRVLDIVPDDSPLVVESRIRPEDVDEVRLGMRAEIRLTGLNHRVTPIVGGKVVSISADRLSDPRSGEGYFEVLALIDPGEVEPYVDQLLPGMPALAMFPTREKTALTYLLKPLIDGYDRALRD